MSGLPSGWREASISQLCEINPKHSNSTEKSTMVSFVPMSAVDDVRGEICNPASRQLSEVWTGYTHFAEGDVIFAKITPCMENGKIAVARYLINGLACGSTEFHVLRPTSALCCDYLWWFLRQPAFRRDAEAQMTGAVGQRRVPKSYLERCKLPLPPIDEQKRIVETLNDTQSRISGARNDLQSLQTLAKNFQQAILAKAFSGELTADWRRDQQLELDWVQSTISQVARISSGQTPKGISEALVNDGDLPWFKVSSMNQPENINGLTSSSFNLSRQNAAKLGLRVYPVGSIAFPKRGGAIATNKKRRLLVEGALDLNQMVLTAHGVSPDYLWWWVQTLHLASISNGSNVPQINNGDVEPLSISVPSSAEQAEISRRLDIAWSRIDAAAKKAAKANQLLDHLESALHAQAFNGRLVVQA